MVKNTEVAYRPGEQLARVNRYYQPYRGALWAAAAAASTQYGQMARTRSGKRFRSRPSVRTQKRIRAAPALRSNQRQMHSGLGVTVQHDERRIYSKRSMPRYKKRGWKRFTNKVHAVSEKDLGSRTVVFNKSQTFSNTTAGNQGLSYCSLYSVGSTDSWMDDIVNLSGLENIGNPTAAAGDTVYNTTKWLFKSAILDVTLRNVSTLMTGGVDNLDATAKLEVDVYEIISSREWKDDVNESFSVTDALAYGASVTGTLANTGTAISMALRGCSPWDIPAALSYFRLKILKKTKYFIGNGDTFTYQIRDPRRHTILEKRMVNIGGGNLPRFTRHVLCVFKLVPGLTVGTTNGTYKEQLAMGMTRKYFYKIEGLRDDRHRYLNL